MRTEEEIQKRIKEHEIKGEKWFDGTPYGNTISSVSFGWIEALKWVLGEE